MFKLFFSTLLIASVSFSAGLKEFDNVKLKSQTATTVPYLNSSKVLTSSAVTPTQLGYLGGASGTTGTGSVVFNTNPLIDASGASAGIKVETARSGATAGDSQNIYSLTYTPVYAKTGATFSGTVTSHCVRTANNMHCRGYTVQGAGGGTNDITITLPIAPTAFGATDAERAQCGGSAYADTNASYVIVGTSSGTTCTIQGVPDGATGLRYSLNYRIQ